MTELQGAVGLAQLDKVADVARRRNELGDLLSDSIRGAPGILPAPRAEGARVTYWQYGFRVVHGDPARFAEALRAEGIPCGCGYIGKPIFRCMAALASKATFGRSAHPSTAATVAASSTTATACARAPRPSSAR